MKRSTTALRIYICLSMLVTCFLSWGIQSELGKIVVLLSFGVTLVAAFDTVINEANWIPLSLPMTKSKRPLIFMSLSIVSASMAFVVIQDNGYHSVIVRYILDSCASVTVAVLGLKDLHDRPSFRKPQTV